MNIDLKQIILLLSQWLIAMVILAWEQSFALPFLFFVFSLVIVRLQPKYYREVLLLMLGIAFAGLYNFWFGLGVVWLFGLLGVSYAIGHFVPTLKVRILLASLLGTLLLSQVAGLELTTPKAVIVGVSMVLFWILSFFVRWEVRNVPLSKANWGWQQT